VAFAADSINTSTLGIWGESAGKFVKEATKPSLFLIGRGKFSDGDSPTGEELFDNFFLNGLEIQYIEASLSIKSSAPLVSSDLVMRTQRKLETAESLMNMLKLQKKS
jgi:hypothetical protein